MQRNNIVIISILLTVGTAVLGIIVSFVQYIISRKIEKKEIEIKYNINKNMNSNENPVNEKIENPIIEENYLHRLLSV